MMPIVRTIDVPDRYYAILHRFGHEMTGPAGVDPFANVTWAFRLNDRPVAPYSAFSRQLGRVVDPTRIPQPIFCPPLSQFTVRFDVNIGAPAGNYTGIARITGWFLPLQAYITPQVWQKGFHP